MNIPVLTRNLLQNAISGFPSPKPFETSGSPRLAMSPEELVAVAADRRLLTREIHPQNDFYGHATVLKNYCGLPRSQRIKTVIEHGLFFGGFVWDEDIRSPLPVILTYSKARFGFLKQQTQKPVYAIGPLVGYAPHFLSASALHAEKKRLGKNLLVFPAHSTHHVDTLFDIPEYCRYLTEIGRQFDSIRICLYWKDVLKGWGREFARCGFECVSAGHVFDPLFLPRLKSIIECATFTTSNELGTHLGYCVSMGKGHFLSSHTVTRRAQSVEICNRDAPDRSMKPDVLETKKAFSEWCDPPSDHQQEIVDRYWGTSERKSPDQLRRIFEEAEDLYRKGRGPAKRLFDRNRWLFRT